MKKVFFIRLVIIVLMFSSCERYQRVWPSGPMSQTSVEVSDFNGISVSSGFNVEIVMCDSESVIIETQQNILPYIDVYVSGQTLYIEPQRNVSFGRGAELKAYVNAKYLESLNASGGSDVKITETLHSNRFDADLSGGSKLIASVIANTMSVSESGGSYVDLDGELESLTINSSGGSKFYSYDLVSSNLNCDISGGGKVELTVNNELNVNASGGSTIRYKGAGIIRSSQVSGGSEVRKIN
jgi:hypothetical protein